jgi:DNA-binding HxlR family transcriptional regulator
MSDPKESRAPEAGPLPSHHRDGGSHARPRPRSERSSVDLSLVYEVVQLLDHVLVLEILQALDSQPRRYTDLFHAVTAARGAIHPRSFRDTLVRLCNNELLIRTQHQYSVYYRRTSAGKTLLDLVPHIHEWAVHHPQCLPTGDG